MPDIATLESAWLRAMARFEKWKEEVEREHNLPAVQTSVGVLTNKIQNLPPEVQAISRDQHPEAWQNLDKMTKQAQNRTEV